MPVSYPRISQYLSLAVMTLFTILAIYNKSISVFYVVYLFWWDEFLKTLSGRLRYYFRHKVQQFPIGYLENRKQRQFMLNIYFVFIVVFFGLVLNWEDEHLAILNFELFFFRNTLFNLSLLTFVLREIYVWSNYKETVSILSVVSKGILTLHLSIIFGILFWFLASKKYVIFADYAIIISVLPFIILKIIFEVQEIRSKNSEALQEF